MKNVKHDHEPILIASVGGENCTKKNRTKEKDEQKCGQDHRLRKSFSRISMKEETREPSADLWKNEDCVTTALTCLATYVHNDFHHLITAPIN